MTIRAKTMKDKASFDGHKDQNSFPSPDVKTGHGQKVTNKDRTMDYSLDFKV